MVLEPLADNEWGWEPLGADDYHVDFDCGSNTLDMDRWSNRSQELKSGMTFGFSSNSSEIHSSSSFHELDKAIGATLFDSPLEEAFVVDGNRNQFRNISVSRNCPPQNFKVKSIPMLSGKPGNGMVSSSSRIRDALVDFTFDDESRALMVFHSASLSISSIRDACQKFGALYYFRSEFYSRGVTLLCYFDIRAAVQAFHFLAQDLSGLAGVPNSSSVYFSVNLHSTSMNCDESKLLVSDVGSDISPQVVQSVMQRFGNIRRFEQLPDTAAILMDSVSSSFLVEYFDIEDARLASSEIAFVPLPSPWTVSMVQLSVPKQQMCRQLLSVLSKLRAEVASSSSYSIESSSGFSDSPQSIFSLQSSYFSSSGNSISSKTGYSNSSNSLDNFGSQSFGSNVNLLSRPSTTSHMSMNNMSNAQLGYGSNNFGNSMSGVHFNNSSNCNTPYFNSNLFPNHSSYGNHSVGAVSHNSRHNDKLSGGNSPGSNSVSNGNHRRTGSRSGSHVDSDFMLDLHALNLGTETRTTVMVRNIPNKYSQKMLLDEVNNHIRGTYDFFYLPIDFKNRCNVGYCFINFLDPKYILDFVREFDGKKWKNFNSEKVCAVTFARIQGKMGLIARFQNSTLLEKDDEYRPLLFHSMGPELGLPEAFPTAGVVH